jgi:hypothetical protein
MHKESKSRLTLGNTHHHSFHNLPSFHILSKNIKIKTCKIILLLVLYHVNHGLSHYRRTQAEVMILEYRALRKIYGPKRKNIP